jgi:hypothetical protein
MGSSKQERAEAAQQAWVYVRSEPGLWTVGFYDPAGKWQSDSDHDSSEAAAERCGLLNGAGEGYPGIAHDFETCKAERKELREMLEDLLRDELTAVNLLHATPGHRRRVEKARALLLRVKA